MSFTLTTLKAAIDEYTQNTNWGSTDQIDTIIRQAEERINYIVQIANYNTKFKDGFLAASSSYVTIADSETAPLAPIYFRIRPAISVVAHVSSGTRTITPVSMDGIVLNQLVSSDELSDGTKIDGIGSTNFTVDPIPSSSDSSSALSIGNPAVAWSYLLMKDYNFLQEYAPIESTTGLPKYFAFYNDAQDTTPSNVATFSIAPFTDGVYMYETLYFFEPASLVTVDAASSGSKTWLSTHGSNALLYACLVEAYTFLKGEADLMQAYDAKFKEALQTLVMVEQGNYRTTYRNRGSRAA